MASRRFRTAQQWCRLVWGIGPVQMWLRSVPRCLLPQPPLDLTLGTLEGVGLTASSLDSVLVQDPAPSLPPAAMAPVSHSLS